MPFAREVLGYLIIGHPGLRKLEYTIAHFVTTGEFGDRIHRHFHFEIGHCPAAPYDPDPRDVARAPVKNHLLDQTSQQGLAMSIRGGRVCPNVRQATSKRHNLSVEGLPHRHLRGGS